tara:strand:- start:208 stop:2124 length:1917 start_codon:yes stop_codon:yes gene_type:complete
MAEDALRMFRAVCARTRDTGVARNSQFSESVERLFEVERLLNELESVGRFAPSSLKVLQVASELALPKLDSWRAASVTKRMQGYDNNVKTALAELCDLGEAASDTVGPRGNEVPQSGETYHAAVTQPETSPTMEGGYERMPPTLPSPMLRHPPAMPSNPKRAPSSPTAPPRNSLAAAAAADSNAAYTAALEAEAKGHQHIALERMCEAAELGHAAAATRAATALMTSTNTGRLAAPDDLKRAARYLRVAVAAGDSEAMNVLGSMRMRGDERNTGEVRDFTEAASLFANAGARGCAAADYNLAVCRETGAGVEKDLGIAKTLFRRALSLGVTEAHISLGYLAMHEGELGTAARHFEAVVSLGGDGENKNRLDEIGLTRADIADATFCLAQVHERAADVGVARLERAAANGASVDSKKLDMLRSDTVGTSSIDEKENENYENDLCSVYAADELSEQRNATRRALDSTSVQQDVQDANSDLFEKVVQGRARSRELTRAAADIGDGRALFKVGVKIWRPTACLGARVETIAKREAAAKWVLRGAEQGCGGAYRWLGDCAASGACRIDGVCDLKTARALYERSVQLGDTFGELKLAKLEEKTWEEARNKKLTRVYPTAPPKAWRRAVPPEWVDEAVAGRIGKR